MNRLLFGDNLKWPASAHNRLARRGMRRKMWIEISKRKVKQIGTK